MEKTERNIMKIKQVCYPCGVAANVLTSLKHYKRSPKKISFDTLTFINSECDICHDKNVPITEPRDFFYPEWHLLIIKMQKHKKILNDSQ